MKKKLVQVGAIVLCCLILLSLFASSGLLLQQVQASTGSSLPPSESASQAQHAEEGFVASIVTPISEFLQNYLSPQVIVFIISLMPILELRGGMIAATLLELPLLQALLISIIANMIPIPFIILFIERILSFLSKHGPIKKLARAIEQKGRKKGSELQEKYPRQLQLGLFLFVAIPLPGTGAWTGSLIAALLGLKPRRSAPAICLGVLGASAIMAIATYLVPWMLGWK